MLLAFLLVPHACISAEEDIRFTVVKDNTGDRHISMIPEAGYTVDGGIKESHNPNSIVYQHARMLEELKMEHRELTRKSIEEETAPADIGMPLPKHAPGNIFSGINTNTGETVLDKLIELEKRGGRTAPVDTADP